MDLDIEAVCRAVDKVLGLVTGGPLEAWAATTGLGTNIWALRMELLSSQWVLNSTRDHDRGRKIQIPVLAELLQELWDVVNMSDNMLDELDYFRIQDEIQTFLAADEHYGGCIHNQIHIARHTARAIAKMLGFPKHSVPGDSNKPNEDARISHGTWSGLGLRSPDEEQEDASLQVPCGDVYPCGRVTSTTPIPLANQGDQEDENRYKNSLVSSALDTIYAIGKHFPCYSVSPLQNDVNFNIASSGDRLICGRPIKAGIRVTQGPKFNRVNMSKRLKEIVAQLKHVCTKVSKILNQELLDSNRSFAQCVATSINAGISNEHWHTTNHRDSIIGRPITMPEHIDHRMYGRGSMIEKIIDDITRGKYYEKDLTILPIVGPGGVGKTTLTQKIYHELQNYFEVKMWLCVSDNFNVDRMTEEIASFLGSNEKKDSAYKVVEEILKYKKFLLVLDDMWTFHEDDWKQFLMPFRKGPSKGSVIIITTRIPMLAEMVKTTDCVYLKGLESEAFRKLFLSCIFGGDISMDDHIELLDIGYEIAKKLKGSPLAAKTVGRLLRKHLTLDHWIRVLESKEWELSDSSYDVMTALKLSFDSLPFHLKQCFTYCTLFPEDYEFTRDKLIHLWIGQDFLHSHDEIKRVEDIGDIYLTQLVEYGFFKMENDEYGHISYVIHDLLHELGQKVSSHECLSIYNFNVRSVQISPSIRHLSINIDDSCVKDKVSFDTCKRDFGALEKKLKIENLQSVMLFGKHQGSFVKIFGGLFSRAKALRVILISGDCLEVLLHNLSNPINLRYLRIEGGFFRSPLSNISRFYNLRVLDLERTCLLCHDQSRYMSNLVKLRHFLVPDDNLHASIFEAGRLKSLQELRRFEVGKESHGFNLRQIGNLLDLRGSLCISNLEKVQVIEDADEAKLVDKIQLHKLMLDWDSNQSCKDPTRDEQVLEGLKPASNLLELCIRGHGGTTCPSWLGMNLSVEKLECLRLDGVAWKIFPPIGELFLVHERGEECSSNFSVPMFRNLRRIELVRIAQLKKWAVDNNSQLFFHLEVLIIKHCPELMELSFSLLTCNQQGKETWPRRLQMLKIDNCPKLLSLAPVPWSRSPCSISIGRVALGFEQLTYEKNYEGALSLRIVGKDDHDSALWMALSFDHLTDLKELETIRCPPLPHCRLQVLPSLRTLVVSNSKYPFSPVEDGRHLQCVFPVECFDIRESVCSGKELTQVLCHMPHISKLKVSLCLEVTKLGVMEQHRNETSRIEAQLVQQENSREKEEIVALEPEGPLLLPPRLQELRIEGCPNLCLLPDSHGDDKEIRTNLRAGGLQALCSLRSLEIWHCPKFLCYFPSPSSCFPFPTSLQKLFLICVKGMDTLAPLTNLVSLTTLKIEGCGDLRGDGLWHILAQGCLTELYVSKTPNFFIGSEPSQLHKQGPFFHSSNLQVLHTDDIAGVLAAPICCFLSSSLTRLILSENKEMERFAKQQEEALQSLSSLQELFFWHCDKLQYLPSGLSTLPNLKKIELETCPSIRALPNEGFPDSLQELKIICCPAIRELPRDGFPCSLRVLDVRSSNNEELRRKCQMLIGSIPIVEA